MDTDGDSDTDADNESKGLNISNLTVEANPKNVLSAFVSWTTDQAADSEVQFGVDDFAFRIRDDEQVTDHQVLVIFEVTRDGQVVWDMTFPYDRGVYRSQRIPTPPLIEPITN